MVDILSIFLAFERGESKVEKIRYLSCDSFFFILSTQKEPIQYASMNISKVFVLRDLSKGGQKFAKRKFEKTVHVEETHDITAMLPKTVFCLEPSESLMECGPPGIFVELVNHLQVENTELQ